MAVAWYVQDSPLLHHHEFAARAMQSFSIQQVRKQLQGNQNQISDLAAIREFIRDEKFRKNMIDVGRNEEICREMDKLANEDHTHRITEEEIRVYRNNLVDPFEHGEFRHDARKASS